MIKKWIFVAGAAVGYVLGTRAGRQQYEVMKSKAKEVLERPDVQEVTQVVKAEANRLYDEGRQRVRDKVGSVRVRPADEPGLGIEPEASSANAMRPINPN